MATVLPGWVPWAGPLLALGTLVSLYLVIRLVILDGSLRIASRQSEWTERARHVHVARMAAAISTVLLPGFAIAAAIAFVGPLSIVPTTVFAVVLALFGLAASLRMQLRMERYVYGPSDEKRPHATLGMTLGVVPILVLFGLGLVAPPELSDWSMVPWLAVVLAVIHVWLRAPLVLLRTPLAQDGDARVAEIVERASTRLGYHVERAIAFRSRQPNAFAFPWLGVLAFTTGLLEALDDDELEAITYHEIAHLAEKPGLTRLRQAQLYALVPIVAARPIAGSFGLVGPLMALLLFVVVARVLRRRSLAAEHASDAAAIDAIHQSDAFGRALEKTYRIGLIPAVLRRATHGQLHERLEAAGIAPGFEPPAPPPRRRFRLAFLAAFVVLVASWFSPWLAYALVDEESLMPTHFSAALPIYGSDALEWLATEAELDERWRDSALLYEAAAQVRPADQFLRWETARLWAFAGDCRRAGSSLELLDPTADSDSYDYLEELIEWCHLTGGMPASS